MNTMISLYPLKDVIWTVKQINEYGKQFVDICSSSGLSIVNGRTSDDCQGMYTRVHTTGKCVVDYVVVPVENRTIVEGFKVENQMTESDHRPLRFNLNCNLKLPVTTHEESDAARNVVIYHENREQRSFFKWSETNAHKFNSCLEDSIGCAFREQLKQKLADSGTAEDIGHVFQSYIKQALGRSMKLIRCKKRKSFPSNKWFDDDCKQLNKELSTLDPLATDQGDQYFNQYAKYKRTTQKKKRSFQGKLLSEIQGTNDSSKMWSLLKENKNSKQKHYMINLKTNLTILNATTLIQRMNLW